MENQLAALITASIVIMGSPGPSTVSATAVGASFGFRRSLAYVTGLVAGTVAVLLAVSAGVLTAVVAIPGGARVLAGIATVYICYLAFRIATAPPLRRQRDPVAAPGLAGGFLLAVTNPKAYLAIAAVFAGTELVEDDHIRDALVKIVVLSAMIVIIHLGWLSAGAWLSRALHDPVRSRLINVMLAASLVIMTVASLVN